MRLSLLLIPLLSLAALPARADVEVKLQQLKDIGMLPEEKLALRPEEKLDPKRSNPFAERAKAKVSLAVETVETEEIKIRRVFDTLKVGGITQYKGKFTALLGDIIIEEGSQIAPVIPNQTQILRATRVSDKFIEIVWVEGAGYETKAPRRIVKRVELTPRVGVLLAAQPVGTSDPNAMTYLDQNGKVIWPKKMAPDLGGMAGALPASGTASLSPEEEAALMSLPPAPGEAAIPPAAGESSVPPAPASPAMAEMPFTPAAPEAAEGAAAVDPGTAVEDVVQPPESDDDAEATPAEPANPPPGN